MRSFSYPPRVNKRDQQQRRSDNANGDSEIIDIHQMPPDASDPPLAPFPTHHQQPSLLILRHPVPLSQTQARSGYKAISPGPRSPARRIAISSYLHEPEPTHGIVPIQNRVGPGFPAHLELTGAHAPVDV